MLKDITLGQYFPGNSLLHRLDPRTKIIAELCFIVAVFLAKGYFGYAALLIFSAALIVLSRLPVRVILRGMKPLIVIILFTAAINVFWTSGQTLLFSWRFIKIYREGIEYAVFMLIRILTLVIGSGVLLTYTTSPILLTDGIEALLAPLKKLHLPVHEFAMMMTIALRFIPLLTEETDKIMNAQKSRGADFESGNLLHRIKALIPILVPLFISAIYRADELAVAMECRCYRGGEGRTKMRSLRMHAADVFFLCAMLLFCGGLILLRSFGL